MNYIDICLDILVRILFVFNDYKSQLSKILSDIQVLTSSKISLLNLRDRFSCMRGILTVFCHYLSKKYTFVEYLSLLNPLSASFTKWSNKLNQFAGEIADELFECVWPFCRLALKGLRHYKPNRHLLVQIQQ